MTHPDTAKLINDQIAHEFEKLNAFTTFESDKPAILNRISELKAMLEPTEVQRPFVNQNPRRTVLDFIAEFGKR